ncbi:MAG TPA: hypothetical protein VFX03_11855, partial [Thermomicrobiales bacterium]|nr:hypothetical protein [Thermomicrobiales bacterium]
MQQPRQRDRRDGADDRTDDIDPLPAANLSDERRPERTGWIHRCAADRSGEQSGQGDGAADGDAGGGTEQALARRCAEDDGRQHERQRGFHRQRRPGPEFGARHPLAQRHRAEEDVHEQRGDDGAAERRQPIGGHAAPRKNAAEGE